MTADQNRSAVDVTKPESHATPGFWRRLFSPVDIAPLVFFRITFGALMAMEVLGCVGRGLVRDNWIRPEMHFTYFGFGWVQPPPGNLTYALVAVVAVAAIGIMFGAFYRLSAAIFAFGFTWFYLIEQSQYLNHFYLISLLGFVALAIPAHRAFSIDARRKPELRASTAPVWTLWLLQAHIAIAYFFGGVAKLNRDWLRGEPVRTWLESGSLGKKLGPMFQNEFATYAISYSGLLIDLLVVPFLLWKKARLAALFVAIAFHLSNAYLFDIGVFPFLSVAMTCLFLPAAWHRKVLRLGAPSEQQPHVYWKTSWVVASLLVLYFAYHLFMPFRHLFYPGTPHWSEEGHRYAWHMMLRTKNGRAYFIVDDRTTGRLWRVRPEEYLSQRQFTKMSVHPEMLLQFAHYLRHEWSPNDVKVHAVAWVKLNDHKSALLVDPEVDLSREELSLKSSKWILPLENRRVPPRRFSGAHLAPKR